MTARIPRLDWFLFAFLAVAWGSSYLFIRIAVATVPPFTLVASRLAIGLVVLAVVLVALRQRLPRDARTYAHMFVVGMTNIVAPFWLTTWGEQSIDSGLASILNSTIPLFTIVLAAVVLRDERITVARVAGLVVGFAGVLALVGPGLGSGALTGSAWGQAAVLGSSVSYAVANVYARRYVRAQEPVVVAFLQLAFAFAASTVLAVAFERADWRAVPIEAVVSIAWLGIPATGVAYLFWFRLLRTWGPTRSTMVAYLLPLVGVSLGVAFAAEPLTSVTVAGTILVTAGVVIVDGNLPRRRAAVARPRSEPGRALEAGEAA